MSPSKPRPCLNHSTLSLPEAARSTLRFLRPAYQKVHSRNHEHRQQRRRDHATHHGCGYALHDLGAGPRSPHDGKQASQDNGYRHRFGSHAQHRAFTDGIEQVSSTGFPLLEPVVPGRLQVQQHDHTEFRRDTRQRNKSNNARDRQVVAQQVKQPDTPYQRKR